MAYTKYSLTPANNTAAPPDGAPEGMLPSAVNDTMRDMMAQIRDAGDGIRDGTYTMTAPKITGGTITGATFTGNTFSSPVISGGTINNATIGATTASTGAFSTLSATGATTFSGATVVSGSLTANTFSSSGATITGGSISGITDLAVADGGTGASSITSNSVILGNGSSALSGNLVAPSTSGNVLTSNGTTWTSVAGAYPLTSGTAVASTSGTSIDFTSIPSWVKRITVSYGGVSTNGTSNYLVQIGSGSVTSTGYVSTAGTNGGSTATSTAGCLITASSDAGSTHFGQVVITLLNTNVYTFSALLGQSSTTRNNMGNAWVTLGGVLDIVRITTVNGTDTFDAGSINILYE
jgi:hypothetical protein